ncbi:MAG: glycosyltransferase family 2 protein [Pseudomonadota bacterium]
MSKISSANFEILISIINYRTGALTIQCAASALAELEGVNGHVTIIDNLSGDGSAEDIEAWMVELGPDAPISLVRSSTNSGFSGGHNQGIASGQAAFYLILNSDAVLRPGCMKILLEAAHAAPAAGLIAPRLEYEDGTPQISSFRFASPFSELIRGAMTGPVTKLLARYDMPLGTMPDPGSIEWASFACILLRREMIEQVGPMDEGYFLYYEDEDYCWQARKAGWGVVHEPKARVIHYRGGSAPVKSLATARKRVPAYYYASRTRFLRKCYGWPGLIAANLLWHLGRGIANLRLLTGRSTPKANKSEWRDIWTNACNPLGNQRETGV